MADNYLEKKMEQHRARTNVSAAKAKAGLATLLEKCCECSTFTDYAVRADQLQRIVAAASMVSGDFSYSCYSGDEAAALRVTLEGSVSLPFASGYVVVSSSDVCDFFHLGRVVQVMILQAAEIGLSAQITACNNVTLSANNHLSPATCLFISFGRGA